MVRLSSVITLAGAVLVGSSYGCDSRFETSREKNTAGAASTAGPSPSASFSQEDRALLERWKLKEAAREDLRAHPAEFIKAEEPKLAEPNLFDPYNGVKQINFLNRSGFDVSDIRGTISFQGKHGLLGTVPFEAKGFVYAGETSVLDIAANELKGAAERASVVVERVHVWN